MGIDGIVKTQIGLQIDHFFRFFFIPTNNQQFSTSPLATYNMKYLIFVVFAIAASSALIMPDVLEEEWKQFKVRFL